MSDHLLTVAHARERLAVSHQKLYELMTTGELVSFKIGRSRRIPASAVDAFIADHVTAAGSSDAA